MTITDTTSGTISEKVYDRLRDSIINLALNPGDEINIKAMADSLGVSRSPVRDSLLKLKKEGLVDIMPQRGTCVSRIDLSRVHEERFLRECLEEKTIEIFIGRFTKEDLRRLRQNIVRQRKCLAVADEIAFLDQDDEFHSIFFQGADKSMCWSLIHSMSGHYRRIRLLNLKNKGVPSGIISQHTELLDHIERKETAKAIALIRAHLSKLDEEEHVLQEMHPGYFEAERKLP